MSNEFIGKFSELGLAVESVRGTAEDSPEKCLKKIEANFYKNVEKAEDESVVATVVDVNKLKKTQEVYEGEVNMNLHADVIGYLFQNLWGESTTEDLGSGAYKHTFSLLESITRPTLTAFLKDGEVKQEKVSGCVVESLTISGAMDDIISGNFNLRGVKGVDDTSTFSYDQEYDFIGKDVTVKMADTKAGLDTAEATEVKDYEIEMSTGTQDDYTSDGEYYPSNIYQNNLNVSISLTANYKDETFKDLNDSDNSKFIRITIEGDTDIGGGNKPKVELDFYNAFVEDWERGSSRDEVITQEITLRATYNETEETVGGAEVINKTSGYNTGS